MDRTAPAFVLGVGTPNGIGVIRSLGRVGIRVVAVDHRDDAAGLGSRYARPVVVPDPAGRPGDALEALLGEAPEGEKEVLYPTSDAFVLFLSRFRAELEERYRFCVPSRRILEGMVDKRLQYQEAMRVGAPLPPTFFPRDMAEVEEAADRLQYPAFIKPHLSHLWYQRFGNKGFKVTSPGELRERYREVFRSGLGALVQTIIQGPNTNHVKVCAYYGQNGGRHALFLTRKIRQYPVEFGVGTVMESFHDPQVQRIGLDLFEAFGYRGIGSIELKKDERTGQYMLIELNPRLWAQNIQATCAGVNFPLIQYLDVTGQPVGPGPDWRDGVRWMDGFEDARSFWWFRQRGRMGFGELFRTWLTVDCAAYFSRDDIGPFLRHTGRGVEAARLAVELLRSGRSAGPPARPDDGGGAPSPGAARPFRRSAESEERLPPGSGEGRG